MIILASASPRRKELLKRLIKSFRVVVSQVNEKNIPARSPKEFTLKAALAKAKVIAEKFPKATVIGADTIVVLGKKILGKPKNKKAALTMLKKLSGRTHQVMTGLAAIGGLSGKTFTHCEITRVKMKKLADKEIKKYVATGSPLDKAGGYGIQEIEDPFVEKIVGEYDNVVGLPLKALKRLLRRI